MAKKKIVLEHPAYEQMVAAAKNIENARDIKDVPEAALALIQNAQVHIRSAVEVLLEHDPLKRKLAMICLFLLESTDYKADKIDGKIKEVVEISDDYIFAWAIRELHQLPMKFK